MTDDETVRGVFPARFQVGDPDPDGRSEVSDPDSPRRWVLGRRELAVARRFDGARSYAEVAEASGLARNGDRPGLSPDATRRFEARLLRVGLLEPGGPAPRGVDWPRLGAWCRARATVEFAGRNPTPLLDRLDGPLGRLTARGAVVFLAVGAVLALAALGTRAGTIVDELRDALVGAGLLGFLAAFVASALFHEGGHAVACHRYGVPVDRVSIGLRWFIPFAWTRPDQTAWQRLPVRARVVTVLAGPLGGLVFAALGGLLWQVGHDVDAVRSAGLYMLAAGTVGMAPTLVPVLEGDAYLLLELWLRQPNLRSRSFDHLVTTFTDPRRAGRTGRGRRVLYLSFASVSALGSVAATVLVFWAAYRLSIEPAGGR
ncbi:M50 family metallopeptidase [Streptomyces sp. NPDC058653]|uniref:M50 family metallopeptidase n=1 Tax=Streptomyces sp. NPDC058653 TaxID=3346576 RepID=UPI00366284E6